jgi:hypothetical protein
VILSPCRWMDFRESWTLAQVIVDKISKVFCEDKSGRWKTSYRNRGLFLSQKPKNWLLGTEKHLD